MPRAAYAGSPSLIGPSSILNNPLAVLTTVSSILITTNLVRPNAYQKSYLAILICRRYSRRLNIQVRETVVALTNLSTVRSWCCKQPNGPTKLSSWLIWRCKTVDAKKTLCLQLTILSLKMAICAGRIANSCKSSIRLMKSFIHSCLCWNRQRELINLQSNRYPVNNVDQQNSLNCLISPCFLRVCIYQIYNIVHEGRRLLWPDGCGSSRLREGTIFNTHSQPTVILCRTWHKPSNATS
jgi:hypothetical protein